MKSASPYDPPVPVESTDFTALTDRAPPFAALFALVGVFVVGSLTALVGTLMLIVHSVGPIGPQNANPAAVPNNGLDPGRLAALAGVDRTPAWITLGGVTFCAIAVIFIARRVLRRSSRSGAAPATRVIITAALALGATCVSVVAAIDFRLAPELASLFAPLALTAMVVPIPVLYVAGKWVGHCFGRIFERLSYVRVEPNELPSLARRHFDHVTPDLEALGFRRVADYRLKQRTLFFARIFLSDDGYTFGELSTLQSGTTALKACSLVSLMESGDYLETADLRSKTIDHGLFHTRPSPGLSPADLYEAHRTATAELCDELQTELVCCEAEDYPKISSYGQKLMYDRLVAEGILARNIYDDVPPPIPELVAS